MITSPNVVYLSGDFRLTQTDTLNYTDNLDTQKLIPVIRFGWGALIAYTGIANAPSPYLDMGDWVSAQMNEIPMSANIDEIPKRLLSINPWLIKHYNKERLAFSVVGFSERKPFMMLVSNFLNFDGYFAEKSTNLEVFRRKPKNVEVNVTGDVKSVNNNEIIGLKVLTNRSNNYQIVRENIAQLNITASKRSTFISQECITGYLLPSGYAEIGPHGITDNVVYFPSFVKRYFTKMGIIGFEHKNDEFGRPLPPRWVGMTARIQNGYTADAVVAVVNAMRNVGNPINDGVERKGTTIFYKFAEQNEPKHVTFTINKPPST